MLSFVQFGKRAGVKPATTHPGRLSRTRRSAVLLCLLLVGMAMVAQAFHSHPNEIANDAKHCPTCQVAHAPGQPVAVLRVQITFASTAFFIFVAHPDHHQDPDSYPLFCRPPPSV